MDPTDEPLYVISIAAKLAGLPLWTLRVLDKEGIVRPQRTASDRRLYSDRDLAALTRVRYLTEERGVNMNGVKLILEMERAAHAADVRSSHNQSSDVQSPDARSSADPLTYAEPPAPKERIS